MALIAPAIIVAAGLLFVVVLAVAQHTAAARLRAAKKSQSRSGHDR